MSGEGVQYAETRGRALPANVAGSLCYLLGFLTGVFFLTTDPYKRDHFVRFHAFQAIFLSVAGISVFFVLCITLAVVPGSLRQVVWFLGPILALGICMLWLVLMYKARNREQFRLPVIGNLAAKQA